MKLPEGVIGLRKVRTVFGGEDGRTHLTWVLAYNAGIEIGSPRYEAIRTFAGGLKAPRNAGKTMEQSIMFLPVAPPAASDAPPPRKPRRARPKKRGPQAVAKSVVKSAAKRTAKTVAKRTAKPAVRPAVKPARSKPRRTRANARKTHR